MPTTLKDAYIVIVEDDANAQLVTVDLLRMGGITERCFTRKTVASALSFAERLPRLDLFLVDINMPGQSGYDLLHAVRQHPTLNGARVVAVTAGTLEDDVRRARELGFDGFISKPLKSGEFARQVERLLEGEAVWDWR
jgi:two-component system cell cycle response regulator DivK